MTSVLVSIIFSPYTFVVSYSLIVSIHISDLLFLFLMIIDFEASWYFHACTKLKTRIGFRFALMERP